MSKESKTATDSKRLLECLSKNRVEAEIYDGQTRCPQNDFGFVVS
jgi:hypothetical protein